ncbi:hypothetical protein FMEAI12_4330008 [Parafrankia sp. Ea1.12]|nr:hypothetical protein FMEAI12_4330008 [Parafrankia sp. Ea1.12]
MVTARNGRRRKVLRPRGVDTFRCRRRSLRRGFASLDQSPAGREEFSPNVLGLKSQGFGDGDPDPFGVHRPGPPVWSPDRVPIDGRIPSG